MVGIDPDSDGLARAKRLGVATTREGIDGLVACRNCGRRSRSSSTPPRPMPTSAITRSAWPHGKKLIDLTPAAIGPYTVPPVNLDKPIWTSRTSTWSPAAARRPSPWSRRSGACPSRCPMPRSSPRSRRKSAGPGTRANIDEFTETTAKAIEAVGGAAKGKAIIILNPAEPPMIMRDTVYAWPQGAEQAGSSESVERMVAEVQTYVPGYRLKQKVQFERIGDNAPLTHSRLWHVHRPQDLDLPRGRGRRPLSAGLCRQSRHHDLGRHGHCRPLGRPDMTNGVHDAMTDRRNSTSRTSPCATACMPSATSIRSTHVVTIAKALDDAEVDAIEITHGDGAQRRQLQLRLRRAYRLRMDRRRCRGAEARQDHRAAAARHRHHARAEATPMTRVPARCGSPPIAPRPTSRASTSRLPASWAWTPSAS